jgi:hypothetical protein
MCDIQDQIAYYHTLGPELELPSLNRRLANLAVNFVFLVKACIVFRLS